MSDDAEMDMAMAEQEGMEQEQAVSEERALALQADTAINEAVANAETADQELMFLGRAMAGSGFFKDSRRASQAIVKILVGREMGIGPAAAMTGIHVFDGKVVISAALMASMIKRSERYDYKVRQLLDTGVSIEFFENGESVGISIFTVDDAKQAKLWGKPGPWSLYPKNMMYARAMSNGARWYCAGIFNGAVYDPEELNSE